MILAASLWVALSAGAATFEALEPLPTAQSTPGEIPQLPALGASVIPQGAQDGERPLAALPPGALGEAQLALPKQDGAAAKRPDEAQGAELARAFDGLQAQGAASAVPAAGDPSSAGWSGGSLPSPVDGNPIGFKRKDGDPAKPARVYSGGLGLQESFDAYFVSQKGPAGSQYFMWTRGHPPTAWKHVRSPLDADARDLARMIVEAAGSSKTGKVEVALHSYGTLVFQRMTQLRVEPRVRAALKALAGSKVVLLNATTHFEGSERRAGPEFEQMGTAARQFVDWLNIGDDAVDAWRAAARLNPFLLPQANAAAAMWEAQRLPALAMASAQAASMQKQDLEERWPANDEIRRQLLANVRSDAREPGWQEALVRRSNDMFRLQFSPEDVKFLRRSGIRVELVHSAGDKLLNWESARVLFERLGIEAPAQMPAPGSILTDKTGRFRARIVAGDHYFPLKDPAGLAQVLDR